MLALGQRASRPPYFLESLVRVKGRVESARLFRSHDRRWCLSFAVRVEGGGFVRCVFRGRSAKAAAFHIYEGVAVSVDGAARRVQYLRAEAVGTPAGIFAISRRRLKRALRKREHQAALATKG